MTYKEFKTRVASIEAKPFSCTSTHPIVYAMERAQFEAYKLKRLISLGEGFEFKSAQTRVTSWKRQLARVEAKQMRFNNLHKAEIIRAKSSSFANPARVASCATNYLEETGKPTRSIVSTRCPQTLPETSASFE